jgi:hypothetical protein
VMPTGRLSAVDPAGTEIAGMNTRNVFRWCSYWFVHGGLLHHGSCWLVFDEHVRNGIKVMVGHDFHKGSQEYVASAQRFINA